MESSKQRKENEGAERLARRNERRGRQRLERLPKKIEERLIRGKYREAPTIDYGVKHKTSLLTMRIYT